MAGQSKKNAQSLENKGGDAGATGRPRLDQLLVTRGLAESREQAQRLIMAGVVQVEGSKNVKSGHRVPPDCHIVVESGERYVSRGGLKLKAALAAFAINPAGKTCADIGASTGGFTDCLLQHGATRVYAVDVGRSQMHPRLRADARVVVIEETNARAMNHQTFPETPCLIAADLSFISITKVLPALREVAGPDTQLVALIKPQFESTRAEVSRGKGVIRDPLIHRRVLEDAARAAASARWLPRAVCHSPITGGSGNREWFMLLSPAMEGNVLFDIDGFAANLDALFQSGTMPDGP